MELPDKATQQMLVRLALLSTTASTLMKPTGPTLKDDIKQNLKSLSPIYSIAKVLWLLVIVASLRLPRIMSTNLIIWLTLSLYAHWQVCEADPSTHMKHKLFVHFTRRAILIGVTIPTFVAMVVFDDHRWTQAFMAFLVGDAVVKESLTVFSPPTPGAIYLRKDWPSNVLLGPKSGETEISTEIDCHALKEKKTEKAEDNNTEQGRKDPGGKKPSSGRKKPRKINKVPQNLCNKVEWLSNSLLGTDVEANTDREDITKDICTMLRLLYPVRITWTCGHKLCFVYKACSFLAPLVLLARALGLACLVLGVFSIDIQSLLPGIMAIINDTYLLHLACFIAFETVFAVCGSTFILFMLALVLQRFSKAQSILDGISSGLARRTGFSIIRIKAYIKLVFVVWPLQAYVYVINPVPMTETGLSVFLTMLFFAFYTIIGWAISARLVPKDSGNDDVKDTSTDDATVAKGTNFKVKAEMAVSLMFIPVALWFIVSEF